MHTQFVATIGTTPEFMRSLLTEENFAELSGADINFIERVSHVEVYNIVDEARLQTGTLLLFRPDGQYSSRFNEGRHICVQLTLSGDWVDKRKADAMEIIGV